MKIKIIPLYPALCGKVWHLSQWRGSDFWMCRLQKALINKSKNGGRDTKALAEHMSHDSLVIWA